jgi:uncharacterized ferritin-like protein (DUF455 family)
LNQKEIRAMALQWWREPDVVTKCTAIETMVEIQMQGRLFVDVAWIGEESFDVPGRPCKPDLVSPRDVKQRSINNLLGRAALVHALSHIEFNAINLALDAIWRFPGMPEAYYFDWLKVAEEETLHFSLLTTHLHTLGFNYGDFPAHNGLWEMAEKTKDDLLARLALVPRTMEARGLDVTPGIRAKFLQAGDTVAADILDVILRDEIGHVAIGNHWFYWLCEQRGHVPSALYAELLVQYQAPVLRGPVNVEARRRAGFCSEELATLTVQG